MGLSNIDEESKANLFSGNLSYLKAQPPMLKHTLSHQFGYFTMLGDGRAHILGEQETPSGHRVDIQLKGSDKHHILDEAMVELH